MKAYVPNVYGVHVCVVPHLDEAHNCIIPLLQLAIALNYTIAFHHWMQTDPNHVIASPLQESKILVQILKVQFLRNGWLHGGIIQANASDADRW
jgi:hypothetical protein